MKLYKTCLAIAILTTATIGLTGCGPADNTVSAPPETPPSAAELEQQKKDYEAELQKMRERDRS